LGLKFGLAETAIAEESKLVMLHVQNSATGCIVDEVIDIVTLADEDIVAAPTFIADRKANYVKGIGKVGDRLIILLDPEQILSTEEHEAIRRNGNLSSALEGFSEFFEEGLMLQT
jgi:purine-binding chemotaxis protein CheW